jgi:tetratricopeptide (TPR) repeat protein
MARDPNIKVGVETDEAVKNLDRMGDAAIEAEGDVAKLDGESVKIDTTQTTRALQEVSEKLDKTADSAKRAGKDGIPVTTTAFKDLTEGIGGPASGAIGSAFAFGESIEGLGDLVEGFGGQLGLSEAQIGKVTSTLGAALGVLGAVGVGFTVGKAAYDLWQKGAKKAAEEQKKFNEAVDAAEKSLRGVAEALAEGDRARAFRDIVKDLEPDLQALSDAGLDAADAVLEIAGANTRFSQEAKRTIDQLDREIEYANKLFEATVANVDATEEQIQAEKDARDGLIKIRDTTEQVTKAVKIRADGVKGATEIDRLATEALARFGETSDDVTENLKEQYEAQLDLIGATRDFESTLDDVEQAIKDYQEVLKETPDDIEAIDDAARDTADSVINMAEDFGGLEGAARNTEEWKDRTIAALDFVAGSLKYDDPLRNRLREYSIELKNIPREIDTRITNSVANVPYAPGQSAPAPTRGQQIFGGNTTVNVTVTSADPNAVVRAIQTYVRQNGRIPGIG